MPYRDAEKRRTYMRAYMRRKHGFKPRGVLESPAWASLRSPQPGEGKREFEGNLYRNLDPLVYIEFRPWRDFSPLEALPWPWTRSKSAQWMMEYLGYVNKRGYAAAQTSRGMERVSLATGEIGWPEAQRHIYEQQPSRGLTLGDRVALLEYRMIQLEADRALADAL